MPIVVIAVRGEANRYLVIGDYKRVAACDQLGRDTVDAVDAKSSVPITFED
jgi:uncharacterized ParB-like nuclease family protein